jgi:hypothetical protein
MGCKTLGNANLALGETRTVDGFQKVRFLAFERGFILLLASRDEQGQVRRENRSPDLFL